MSEKHTPGPWAIEYDNADDGSEQWYQVGPAKLSFSYNATDEAKQKAASDARLIAAAPELLEALKLFLAYDESDDEDGVAMMIAYADAIQAARAAYAKATKGQA
jgi:hypothetical protein